MLDKIFFELTIFLSTGCAVFPAMASDYGLSATGAKAGFNSGDSVYTLFGSYISAFLAVLAVVFFFLAFYAGIRWMTARGNEDFTTKARETLEGAVIGLVIVTMAFALVRFVLSKIGG